MQSILERLKENKKITAIANIAFTTITNKNISPDIDLIKELKARYDSKLQKGVQDIPLNKRIRDNPLFRLSIEDFENICKDESIKVIIARALNITIKSLTVFCKNVKIFTDNIDSSPNTIKEKMKIKKIALEDLIPELLDGKKAEPLRLNHLPEDILKHITQKSLKSLFEYKLEDGIPENKLDEIALCENPNALYYLITNGKHIDYFRLSSNPNPIAIDLLKEEIKVNPKVHIDWDILSASNNPEAIKLLKANYDKINWDILSGNTNPKAIELLEKRMEVENNFSEHTYDILNIHDKINWVEVSKNPAAIEILKKKIIYEHNLTENRYMRLKWQEKIDWNELSINPSIFTIE